LPKGLPTGRYLIHKACAYPFWISWIIGTLFIWIPLSTGLARSGVFHTLLDDSTTIPILLMGYAGTSGLGYFVGVFFVSWIILPICRKLNGTPHEVGESVVILSGPHAGKTGRICEVATGQGGARLPRVDLGGQTQKRYGDLFEDYELLGIPASPTI
jgi:hypothetical protein